jgi:DtxR family Mn-dependent transcriptional regulator
MRHKTIEEFLRNIGVEEKLLVNVELIEHNVTKEALEKIELLNKFLEEYPEFLNKFKKYRQAYEKKI